MVRRSSTTHRAAIALAVIATAWVLGGSPAVAQTQQDMRPLYDRIERLQRDVDGLQRQLARRGGAPAGTTAGTDPGTSSDFIDRTEGRFQSVEEQLRDLTGRIEQLGNQVTQLTSRLDKLVSDVDFRLNAVEKNAAQGGGAAAAPAPASAAASPPPAAPPNLGPAQVAPGQQRLVLTPGGPNPPAPAANPAAAPGAVQLPQGSPEAQYEFAYGVLLQAQREQADFGRAEQALRAFVAANPQHRLAGNAQYWLGETYYVRRDYQNAAATFAEGLQKYSKSDKAPDNLLKLGMSLGQLNRKNEACGALGEVDKRYPSATAQVKQTAQRERTRLGCT
jgi:tol-pal system protein YbgF